MSLINQMLKDLDARHESEVRGRLHREVRALPAAPRLRLLPFALGGAVLAAAAGGGWLAYERFVAAEAALPVIVAVPTPPAVAVPPVSAPVVLPPAAPASVATSSPETPPPVVADEHSGLKLAATLDRAPDEPTPKRSVPRLAAVESQPQQKLQSQPPQPPAQPQSAPSAAPVPLAAKPAAPTSAVIDKAPVARSTGERADAEYRRAVALAGSGRGAEAVDPLLDALRLDGGHVAARQLLARLLIEQRRVDEAMAFLAEGLAAQPGQIQWAMLLGRLQVERGDLAAASRTLQASQAYATGNADYQGFAGFVAHRVGRQPESAEHYQAAVRLAPGEGRWWFGLGLALEAGQRAADAREAFARARASGTLNAELAALVDQKLR